MVWRILSCEFAGEGATVETIDNVSHARELVSGLSDTELKFLRKLANGHSQAEIARSLDLSSSEADAARASLMKKLGAAATADAVRIAIYAGL